MATKTSLLGLTKPAYTDAADIAVLNTNFDLIDKAVGNRTRVPNLLANSWFVNPVNHRGQTTYSNGYTIDRWSLLYNNVSTLSVTSDGLKFTSGSGDCWLLQRFERLLKVGAPYTFAVQYADGTKDVISLNVADESAYIQGAHCIYSINKDHFAIVGRDIPNGIVIQWVALYEGTYDADTLPTYVVPDKRIEMFRCGVPLNPPNLLVNSWFVNPVNYQGRTGTYEGVANYTTFVLDQWKTWSTGCSYTIASTGLQITNKNTSSTAGPWEVLQNPEQMKGKTYTLAVGYGGGNVVCGSVTVPSGSVTADKYMSAVNAAEATPGLRLVIYAKDQRVEFQIMVVAGQTVTVEWAALYEGAYDAETLPEYVVPDKRAEMIRCGVPLNPPNLLDNSYFRAGSAIAQAGVNGTHGSTKYPLDRWISWDKDITQSTNYITTGSPIDQYIESSKIDSSAVYTAAVCFADGTRQIVFGNFTTGFGSKATGCLYCGTASSGKPFVRMQTGFNICWVALYEGAYDADTLPEYHYKGYAAELAECQRYYIKIATQPVSGWCYNWGRVTVFVPLPVTMRVASPTVSVTSASRNFYIGSTAYAAEPTVSMAVSNGISVHFSHSHTGNGQCIMPEFSAEVSADL